MKRSTIIKTSIILFSLLFFVSSLSLLTLSQTTTTFFSGSLVLTTSHSISNRVYYLNLTIERVTVMNGSSVRSNVSISSHISALGLPPLPLNGSPFTPPLAIGGNIYFAYIPGVTSVSNLSSLTSNLTKAYLACANYNNGSWHVEDIITSGIVSDIAVYNDSLYALWKPSPNGKTYLLTISQNHVVRNVSINVPNASSIEVGNGVGVVSNQPVFSIVNVVGVSEEGRTEIISGVPNITFFVINLTNGKVIYKIPDYMGISPIAVSVSNDLALVSYAPIFSSISPKASYIVLYNLSTGKVLSEKTFYGDADGYINGKFILVGDIKSYGNESIVTLTVYNLSWGKLYRTAEVDNQEFVYFPDGLYVNSTSVTIILTQLSTSINMQTNQVTMTSSLKFITALQKPKPFTISVSEQHYYGCTILNISWNETQPSTYLVYVNGKLVGQTKSEFMQYNVTENGTYLIKVIAENPLGEIQESTKVNVTVYPVQIVTTTTTTSTTTTTTTTTSSTTTTTSSTTSTTSSSSTTTTTTTTSTAVTSSSTISPPTTSSTTTTSHSTTSFSTALVIAIVVIVVIVVGLAVFLARRK